MSDGEGSEVQSKHGFVLPAHKTKHLPTLEYPLDPRDLQSPNLTLVQNDAIGDTTGSTLWLGSQVLAAYLRDFLELGRKGRKGSKKIVELGAGIGLTSLISASLGHDMLATDTAQIVDSVLHPNVLANTCEGNHGQPDVRLVGQGTVEVQELDWFKPATAWNIPNRFKSSPTKNEAISYDVDMIITCDTVYSPDLIIPLLRTISILSDQSTTIYVSLEVRDPTLIQSFLDEAIGTEFRFSCSKVPEETLKRSLEVNLGWGEAERDDWLGVEVWKLKKRK